MLNEELGAWMDAWMGGWMHWWMQCAPVPGICLHSTTFLTRNSGIWIFCWLHGLIHGACGRSAPCRYSPNIKEIKVVDRRKARRAKLYYLRDKIARLSTVN